MVFFISINLLFFFISLSIKKHKADIKNSAEYEAVDQDKAISTLIKEKPSGGNEGFEVVMRSHSVSPRAFIGNGMIDNRVGIVIDFDIISLLNEEILLAEPQIENLIHCPQVFKNDPSRIEFTGQNSRILKYNFPLRIEARKRQLFKCYIELKTNTINPQRFAQNLNELG